MKNHSSYLLIDRSVVPEVFPKVLEVKKLLASGAFQSVNDAVQSVGISRSAYYKYKDTVFPFYEMTRGTIITILYSVMDIPGILSEILAKISSARANILTIHQNLPINSVADITITLEMTDPAADVQQLLDLISTVNGIKRQEILSRS